MARIFNPGDYRHKITFLERSNGFDEYGEPVDEWKEYKTTHASKEPLLGNEFFSALSKDSNVDVKFNMRYKRDITSEMRIRHGSDVYEIIGPPIDVKSMHKELLCYCRMVK